MFPSPLRGPEDLSCLAPPGDACTKLQYVFDALTLTRKELKGKATLIGFSGAPVSMCAAFGEEFLFCPFVRGGFEIFGMKTKSVFIFQWTIMAYMIEGKGSKTMSNAKGWLYKHAEASHKLLKIITEATIHYLVGQVKAGAQVKVFLKIYKDKSETIVIWFQKVSGNLLKT